MTAKVLLAITLYNKEGDHIYLDISWFSLVLEGESQSLSSLICYEIFFRRSLLSFLPLFPTLFPKPKAPISSSSPMETLALRGTLKGHSGWVTAIATSPETPDTILSASRGRFPPYQKRIANAYRQDCHCLAFDQR
jgi:hypothetical protein